VQGLHPRINLYKSVHWNFPFSAFLNIKRKKKR
jgi:hypothetical protein